MAPLTGTLRRSCCGSVDGGEHLLSSTTVPAMLSAVGWSKNADGHELLSGGATRSYATALLTVARSGGFAIPCRAADGTFHDAVPVARVRPIPIHPPPPDAATVVVVIILNFCFCYSTDSLRLQLLKYGHLHCGSKLYFDPVIRVHVVCR